MTRPDGNYDDTLSRVLHSTLDPVEPAGDGLAKIQRRIAEPWLKRRASLLRTELAALAWLIFVRCEPFLTRARAALAPMAAGSHRGKASSGRRHAAASHDRTEDAGRPWWLGPTMSWLRPTLAVGAAVVIVVAGVFALGHFREAFINPADNGTSSSTHGGHGHGSNPGGTNGHTGPGLTSSRHTSGKPVASQPAGQPSGKAASKGAPEPSFTSPAAPSPYSSPSPSSMSPSPSPSPTSASPTPTPSPTTSPTTTAGDAASPAP
jgi:hypothetical protein